MEVDQQCSGERCYGIGSDMVGGGLWSIGRIIGCEGSSGSCSGLLRVFIVAVVAEVLRIVLLAVESVSVFITVPAVLYVV